MSKLLFAVAALALLGSVVYFSNRESLQDDEVPADVQQQFLRIEKIRFFKLKRIQEDL
jgi:hypothetical protein